MIIEYNDITYNIICILSHRAIVLPHTHCTVYSYDQTQYNSNLLAHTRISSHSSPTCIHYRTHSDSRHNYDRNGRVEYINPPGRSSPRCKMCMLQLQCRFYNTMKLARIGHFSHSICLCTQRNDPLPLDHSMGSRPIEI